MKSTGFTAFVLLLTAGTAAEAQTVISRQVKSEPVETVVTRQANGTVTTTRRPVQIAALQPPNRAIGAPSRIAAAHRAVIRSEPRRVARAPLTLNPVQQHIIYRTIVQHEVLQAPQPQMVVVREPRTTWVPSPLPPFSYPVTTYEDRVAYVRPAYQAVVDDEDEAPVVRTGYTPATYVVGARLPQTVRLVEMPQSVTVRVPDPALQLCDLERSRAGGRSGNPRRDGERLAQLSAATGGQQGARGLEHFAEKWAPVFRRKCDQRNESGA